MTVLGVVILIIGFILAKTLMENMEYFVTFEKLPEEGGF